ncbi:MAG: hypothetical protein EP330_28735 [Deltaproteobacteria bacterium]|nr:MAG: hypothetical protein EP330_28735 [Deltaproteobacteria bacterium]
MKRILLPALGIAALTACAFDEGLIIEDIEGKIILPPEALSMEVPQDDGTDLAVGPDVRMIGPVFVGLYPGVGDSDFPYPHPLRAPTGDALPYGGTTLGDYRFGCFEDLACKVLSGRFTSYDEIVEWLGVFEEDFFDAYGNPVTSGDYIRQVCFEQLYYTSDEEIRILPGDKNDNGEIDAGDLDFVLNESTGNYEGNFKIWQQEFTEGFSAWAYMDAPDPDTMAYRTCNSDPQEVRNVQDYNQSVVGGSQFQDVLNYPNTYITRGDWVGSMEQGIHTYETVTDDVEIWIDFKVGGQ